MKRSAIAVGCLFCCGMTLSHATPNSAQAPICSAPATDSLAIGASTLCIDLDQPTPARRALVHDWVERSAHIVAAYYGQFPARLVTLTVGIRSSGGVGGGRTTNDDGLRIRVDVGAHTTGRCTGE